jgi:hypothetical protein
MPIQSYQKNVLQAPFQVRTWLNLVQQSDVPLLAESIGRQNMSDNVQVLDVRDLLVQSRKFVEMSRKQAERIDFR